MKKTICILSICFMVALGGFIGMGLLLVQHVLADDQIKKSDSPEKLLKSNYDSISYPHQYPNSLSSLPLPSKTTDVLTTSFSSIIDTQLYIGMDK